MVYSQFNDTYDIKKIINAINKMKDRKYKIMEICGTHTTAIARFGIRSLLPSNVMLISGPGCPVCVTPMSRIDNIFEIAENKNVIIATYGDMVRVPGSMPNKSLEKLKAQGAKVEIVYSPIDAVYIAKENINKDVVFLAIGFETTVPGTALAISYAEEKGIKNFYVFSLHKTIEPVMRNLISEKDFDIDGFLCPGHVASVIGVKGFEFLSREYNIPSVICGFEAGDILVSIYMLLNLINNKESKTENEYIRCVNYEGNIKAQSIIKKYFEPRDDLWRGIGEIKNSGLKLKEEYFKYDAEKRFSIELSNKEKLTACRCGDVIKGKINPFECSLFEKECTPWNPIGPCMVSCEGTCAAYYKYMR